MNRILAALAFLALSSPTAVSYSNVSDQQEHLDDQAEAPVEVLTGMIGHHTGNILSHGFYYCSAIILDYGRIALLAHVTPYDRLLGEDFPISPLYIDNAVSEMFKYAASLQLSGRPTVVINAADEPTLQKLTEDFADREIPVAEANIALSLEDISESLPRSVRYDPRTDILQVYVPKTDFFMIKKVSSAANSF